MQPQWYRRTRRGKLEMAGSIHSYLIKVNSDNCMVANGC